MLPREREVRHCVDDGRDAFGDWLDALKDVSGRAAILKRIDRIEEGDFGDHRHVGIGVWELRIHFGPGYRVYYGEEGPKVILLLCGGNKAKQRRDVAKAQRLWVNHRRLH
ncbi:MAG TPA: addiction module killer protein [Elusimicrobia bacterium]|nr:addiction module killer protein [Elusimicrobiota bacterium]